LADFFFLAIYRLTSSLGTRPLLTRRYFFFFFVAFFFMDELTSLQGSSVAHRLAA
jgi:hypothetical protein